MKVQKIQQCLYNVEKYRNNNALTFLVVLVIHLWHRIYDAVLRHLCNYKPKQKIGYDWTSYLQLTNDFM